MIAAPFSTLRQYGGVVIFDNHYRRACRLRGSALASEARDLSGNRFFLSEVGCAGRRGRRRLAQIAPRRGRSVIRPTARFRPGLTCQIPGPAKSRPFCQRFVVALRTSPEDVQDCRRLRTTLIGMLIVGDCFGIRSERRPCDEVHLNLAYRWFCRLGLDGEVPDHSTFSKNRHGRFRESDLLRKLFETVAARCMKEGIVGAFAVDVSHDCCRCASTAQRRQG
jgi:hypothetical protein